MIDSGRIDITLTYDGQRVRRVAIASSRPMAARALIGRPLAQALELVPMLFSLCGRAQGMCARVASAAATDTAAPNSDDMLPALAAEMAFEHLWRFWIDWPLLLGLPADRQALAQAAAALRRCSTRADARGAAAALAPALARVGEIDAPALLAALGEVELAGIAAMAHSMPAAPLAALRAHLPAALDTAFAQAPTVDALPAETGPMIVHAQDARIAARRDAGLGVAARLVARLVALERCLAALRGEVEPRDWIDVIALGSGEALARVETARGLLMHRVRVEGGRIADYAIVAPTEWNFHPRGALASALEGCACADEARVQRHAAALVLALDPCVEHRVAVVRA